MTEVSNLLSSNNFKEAINYCVDKHFFSIAFLISKISNCNEHSETILNNLPNIPPYFLENVNKKIRILLCCSWTSSENICKTWRKMSMNNNCCWNDIHIVSQEPADYYCVINRPPPQLSNIDKKKTILFRMEPYMENDERQWGDWSKPNISDFLFVGSHNLHLNNMEWHLAKTYNELMNEEIEKDISLNNVLTTILSDKYSDKGHIKRIDFVKFLEKKGINVHVFGGNKFLWKNYKGSLPYHKKDDSLFPYKYSFNCENHSIKNYCTEKLIDGILAETLVFYSGCFNIKDYIDEKAFIYLELSNFENDYNIIKKAIEEDWYSQRLPYIKEAKKKILNELQFFPRLEHILKKN